MIKDSSTSGVRPGFSLAEVLAALTIAAMVLVAVLALTGCVSPGQVLEPYIAVPATCDEIDAEMLELAGLDATVFSLRGIKEGAVASVGLAAAAGTLPTGFAWAPLGAAAIGQVRLGTHETRISYLAYVREMRKCEPLMVVVKVEE